MTKYRTITVSLTLALAAAAVIAANIDVQFDVRPPEADDVISVTLARAPDGWIETWVFTSHTSDDEPIGPEVFQHVVTGPPGENQINALVSARLNQLEARLIEKYQTGGPPGTVANPGNGGGRGGKP